MASYNRYSHHARRALTHANLLVQQFQHPRVNTGHLLVGVLLARGSIGHTVLTSLSLDFDTASERLQALVLPLANPSERPPYDAALDIALNLATDESAWLGHHYIGTEHLLLGITRTNVGNASDLLHDLKVAPETVRHRVRLALDDGMTEQGLTVARRSVRLTELSRRVITTAEQRAVTLDNPQVGLGHLLLALLNERRSPTAPLLRDTALGEEQIQQALQQEDPVALVSLEKILIEAGEQARRLGDHYTGTDHLLLTLTLDEAGAALLRRFGVNPDQLRDQISQRLVNKR